MIGVIFLSYPQLIVPSLRENVDLQERQEKYPHFTLGVILVLSASICSGLAYLSIRKMGTNVSSVVSTLYFGVFSVPACFIFSLMLGDELVTPVGG